MAVAISSSQAFTVSVKTLCAFAAKAGDLDPALRPGTERAGRRGRPLSWCRRVEARPTNARCRCRRTTSGCTVRGRADGFDPQRLPRRRNQDLPRRLRRHQAPTTARCTGPRPEDLRLDAAASAMRCPRVDVALVYLDLGSGERKRCCEEHCSAEALRGHFEALCAAATWRGPSRRPRTARRSTQALGALAFPHAGFRAGQRELAEARLPRGASTRRCLLAQAPTGIGKTVATTLPAAARLRPAQAARQAVLPHRQDLRPRDRAGRHADLSRAAATSLRVLELTAREKVCEYPGRACHGDACPLARGFYDRLPAARAEAVAQPLAGHARRCAVWRSRTPVCPYFLAQEMVRWSDVVVGRLQLLVRRQRLPLCAGEAGGVAASAVLVDEAHNLLERARGMYSASARRWPRSSRPRAEAPAGVRPTIDRLRASGCGCSATRSTPTWRTTRCPSASRGAAGSGRRAGRALSRTRPTTAHGPAAALLLRRRCSSPGWPMRSADHSVFESALADGRHGGRLAIRNLVPAPFLRARFADAVDRPPCFSARWRPSRSTATRSGLPAGHGRGSTWPRPSEAHQLDVRVGDGRVDPLPRPRRVRCDAVVGADRGAATRAGPATTWPSSAASTTSTSALGTLRAARIPACRPGRQSRGMREAEREAFVARFAPAAAASASRCSAAPSAKASTCRATAWSAPSSPAWACRSTNELERGDARAHWTRCSATHGLRLHLPLPGPAARWCRPPAA